LKIKVLEEDGREDIFFPQARRRELKLIRERLIGLLPTLALNKEGGIEVTEVKRVPTTRSYFFLISSESESGEFDPQLTQTIEDVINTVLSQRESRLKKGGKKWKI